MRLLLTAVTLSLALAAPVAAEQWGFEGGATPIAWIDSDGAQFHFACRGGSLAMGFWVKAPEATVAGAAAMSLALTPDPAAGSAVSQAGGTSFAQDMPLVHLHGSSAIVRGPVARQWARIAQNARETMRVAYVRLGGNGLEVFDTSVFGARGSKAAIAQVLGECG
jgi:hypothetical protein